MSDQTLVTPDGERLAGYVVGSGRRSVIVVHEIFGVTPHIRQLADRFAAEGFAAFAIDLFDGKTTDDLQQGFALAGALDWGAAARKIVGAATALRSDGRSAAVVGFCMGGALALMAAAAKPSPGPCVCFYGIPRPEQADLRHIEGRVLLHFGTRDAYIATERIDALEALLRNADVRARLHRYDADHGFMREAPQGAAATLAWQRTIAFLQQELGVA